MSEKESLFYSEFYAFAGLAVFVGSWGKANALIVFCPGIGHVSSDVTDAIKSFVR